MSDEARLLHRSDRVGDGEVPDRNRAASRNFSPHLAGGSLGDPVQADGSWVAASAGIRFEDRMRQRQPADAPVRRDG